MKEQAKSGCSAPAGMGTLLLLAALLFGCSIPLPPGPVPVDPVIVTPIAGDLFVVVVEETGDRTVETANTLQGSSDFWHSLKARGVTYRWYDDDSDDAIEAGYVKAVKERPGVLIFSKTGKILKAGTLPSVKDIDALLKGFGK